MRLASIFRVLLILTACSAPVLGDVDGKFDSFGAINCEDEMARLDNLAVQLANAPDSRVYIVIYGGKSGTYRDEVRVRSARMKRYLIENRGVGPEKIKIIAGGYRDSLTVELWIVQNDKPAPPASPTVDLKTVRFKKGKMARYNEPGCFPGKYLTTKFHARHVPLN